MQDFDTQEKLLRNRLARFGEQQYQAPQGKMVGRHFIAPNALQHIAAGLRGYGGIQGVAQTEQELKDLTGKRQTAIADALRTYGDEMMGAPEQRAATQAEYFDEADRASLGGNQNLTAVTPARQANPVAANMALMNAPDANLRQMGMRNVNELQQKQLAEQQAKAKQAQQAQLWQQSGGNPQSFLAAGGDFNFAQNMVSGQTLGKPKVARTIETVDQRTGRKVNVMVDEFGNQIGDAMPAYVPPRAPAAPRAPNVIQTATGPMILNPDGSARPVTGVDGRPVQGAKSETTTESERKSGTLLTRLRGSQAQLAEVTARNPDAASPNFLGQALSSVGLETAGNLVTSSDRQRVNAAQLDLLDAALTLGTGAAYTREQLEGYRKSFFPQIGDSEETIRDKEERLKNVIAAAEVAAGRAEPESVPRFGPGVTRPGPTPQNAPQTQPNINSILDKYK